MSLIAKWALQLVAVVLVGWAAAVSAGWSGGIVNGTSSDRLAQLSELSLSVQTEAHETALAGNTE